MICHLSFVICHLSLVIGHWVQEFDSGLTLQQEAQAMKAIGCHEAIKLFYNNHGSGFRQAIARSIAVLAYVKYKRS
ncbi:hypothetical protein [uncultured Nostoc sp.]|uniref:hypothetical protein n=1 Tax=uncultured Nostoc sp. TaxID=340711 RepID=UPI0035CA6FCE